MKKYEIEINNEVYRVSVKELPADTDMTSPQNEPSNEPTTQPTTQPTNQPHPSPAAPAATESAPTAQTPTQTRSTEVKAPMAGTIFKVPVTSGQAVSKGDTLIILEAMKMENEIFAPVDGIVGEIFVSPNDPVQPDQLLLTI